ncbi:MAG: UDP-N-acetylglucosamine 2-epimerase (non-hydrolyzing) [Fibrobacter sp.]|nr:UDP-N-acetylglucosamine 2-epimerase (non-hydrolyzing) [Fibrobacter sp.]
MKKIILVAGARPNFMKIAPILRAFEKKSGISTILVHTGQHYDENMSGSFFRELGIKEPDYHLNAGSGSHAVQTANIMIKFEEVCIKEKPDTVLVVGDVNSTIAAGLVAKKLHIQLAHVEAGLRSRDRGMPEEINRLATDAISDIFFTTEPEGTSNLQMEGVSNDRIHFVGHVMIDNLFFQLSRLSNHEKTLSTFNLKNRLSKPYICMTMHRPSNVDNKEILSKLLHAISTLSKNVPVIFPCHPRTRKMIETFGLTSYVTDIPSEGNLHSGINFLPPLGYDEFLYLWKDAALVLTDSGGLQEETTALKIPCITMRENTERPVTASVGSNEVVGTDPQKIISLGQNALSGTWKESKVPELWDGKASERIAELLS